MAKKGKKSIGKPAKKSGSKKKSNGAITKILVVIFVLILAFFLIFSVFRPGSRNQDRNVQQTTITENQQNANVNPADEATPTEEPKGEVKEEVKKEENTDKQMSKKEEKKAAETKAVEQSISGKWMSTTGGAFLTMGNNSYTIDFMGVDGGKQINGTYSVDGDIITMVNTEDPCKDVIGIYEVKFDNQEIGFKCKSDDCTKRKAVLPTEWSWLVIK